MRISHVSHRNFKFWHCVSQNFNFVTFNRIKLVLPIMFHSAGPPAPKNPELREAINRFAAYIAKNGPQAEEAEKNRNYNNPRFSFLFNGEGATYYQFRLAMEINNRMFM
jgi:hypothetical protein